MYAASNGRTDVIDVKILLENGADIHAKDNYGKIIIIILTHCYPLQLFLFILYLLWLICM